MSFRSMGLDFLLGRAQNAADATAPTDLTTLQQVQALIANYLAGLSWKVSVRAATTAAGTLSTSFVAGQVIDGVTLAVGDPILVKNQANGAENGIRIVPAAGVPPRRSDADTSTELLAATVTVREGTVNADKAFTQTTDAITLDTTALVWALYGAGQTYTAGNGLSLVGSIFNVIAGAGLISDGASVRIDPSSAYARRSYAADIPSTTAGSNVVLTHGLNSLDVVWQVFTKVAVGSTPAGVLVDVPDVTRDATSITLNAPVALPANTYRFVATLAS